MQPGAGVLYIYSNFRARYIPGALEELVGNDLEAIWDFLSPLLERLVMFLEFVLERALTELNPILFARLPFKKDTFDL